MCPTQNHNLCWSHLPDIHTRPFPSFEQGSLELHQEFLTCWSTDLNASPHLVFIFPDVTNRWFVYTNGVWPQRYSFQCPTYPIPSTSLSDAKLPFSFYSLVLCQQIHHAFQTIKMWEKQLLLKIVAITLKVHSILHNRRVMDICGFLCTTLRLS